MEFQKIKLHRSEKNRAAVTQITLDDDYNVPDYRQDIVKVIKERGELRFDEVKAMEGAAWIKGSLLFKVLYRSDKQEGKISCLRGEIPFQERLNMDSSSSPDGLRPHETPPAAVLSRSSFPTHNADKTHSPPASGAG